MTVEATSRPALDRDSRLCLHPLAERHDGEEWIVGRSETGNYVALPDMALTVIEALRRGRTVGEAKQAADAAHDSDVDALDFCQSLIALGFVAAVDGVELEDGKPRPPSLRRLRPRHVAWLVGTPAWLTALAVTITGFCYAGAEHALPGPSDLFVVQDQGVNLLLLAAIAMSMLALHEFCHLAAARAADVHAWLGWGTRLTFLVAQTTVPGLWMARRRDRVKVYAAGAACDLLIAACAAAVAQAAGPGTFGGRVLEAVSVNGIVSVLMQFELYMRTDVYFVVQDLLGCKRLFDDATAYLGYVAARLLPRLLRRTGADREDPRLSIPARERRSVTGYAWFVLVGSTVTLALFVRYGIAVVIHVYALSFRELGDGLSGGHLLTALDGACALLATAPLNFILLRTLLRKHGPRLRKLGPRLRRGSQPSAARNP